MKGLLRAIGFLIAAGLFGYFLWFASNAIDWSLVSSFVTSQVLWALLVAASLYAAIIPITGWAWARLLAGQGEIWSRTWLTASLATTQLAKYVPGNIAQHAGRAALAVRKGMTSKALAVTVAQETILAVAASVLVGLTMLALSGPGLRQLPQGAPGVLTWLVPVLAIVVLTLGTVRLAPEDLADSPNWGLRILGRMGGLPGPRIILPALAAYILNYLLIGVGLWLLARSANLPATIDLAVVTAAFSLSWLLGFLAPGAPAGLGVREGILVIMLSGTASDSQLLAYVILARLTTMLGDGINFVLGTLWLSGERER